MYMPCVDVAGAVHDHSQSHCVLGGISVFERQTHLLSVELEKIAARFNPADPDVVELHGSPMFNGRSREGWRTFPLPERMVAMKDAPSVLARSHKTNTVFAIAVRKSAKPH